MSAPKPKRGWVSFEPGFHTSFALDAIARPEFVLAAPPATALQALRTNLTLRGRCKNLPEDTPCTITWRVKSEGMDERTYTAPKRVALKLLRSGVEFMLDVELDAFALELWVKGSLACEVQPKYPYCPAGRFDFGKLTFDNVLRLYTKWHHDQVERVPRAKIGTLVELSVERRGCFRDVDVKLDLFEADLGAREVASREGLARTFRWYDGAGPQSWRVGCTEATGPIVFDYQDPTEVGALELHYTLSIADPEVRKKEERRRKRKPDDPEVDDDPKRWKEVPILPEIKGGVGSDELRRDEPKKGRVEARVRFLEFDQQIRELRPTASLFELEKGIHVSPLSKRAPIRLPGDVPGGARTAYAPAPLSRWVYAFKHDKKTKAITVIDERFHDAQGAPRVVPDLDPTKHERKATTDSPYLQLSFDADEADVYFCLSRIQLPPSGLRRYLTDGKAGAEEALQRVKDRCLRYAPSDPSFMRRYLDRHNGLDVEAKLEAEDVEVLYLCDHMSIVEKIHVEYLAQVERVLHLSRTGSYQDTQGDERLQQRFLAGFVGHVLTAYGRTKGSNITKFFDERAFDAFVSNFDGELSSAQELAEFWQHMTETWVDDTHLAADDEVFLGNAYGAVRADYLRLRGAGEAVPDAPELPLYEAHEGAWFVHWRDTVSFTSFSELGKRWLVRMFDDPDSTTRRLLMNEDGVFTSGSKAPGDAESVVDVLVEHVIMPVAKTRENVTSALDEIAGGVGVIEKTLRARLPDIFRGLDYAGARFVPGVQSSGGFLRIPVPLYEVGSDVAKHTAWIDLPAQDRLGAQVALDLVRSDSGDLAQVRALNAAESAAERQKKLHAGVDGLNTRLQRVMFALNLVNVIVQFKQVTVLLDGKATGLDKLKAALSLGEAMGDFVASLEVVSGLVVKAGTRGAATLTRVAQFAGRFAAVAGVVLAVWNAKGAIEKGNWGAAIGHIAGGLGAASILVAGFMGAGAATSWVAGIGIVLMGIGLVLALVFGDDPDPSALELWLQASPWGKKPKKDRTLEDHIRLLLEIILKPAVVVRRDGYSIVVEIYTYYYIAEQTSFQVRSIELTQLDTVVTRNTTVSRAPAWLPKEHPTELTEKPWPERAKGEPEGEPVTTLVATWEVTSNAYDPDLEAYYTLKLTPRFHAEWKAKEDPYSFTGTA